MSRTDDRRAAIDRALDHHTAAGRIRSWQLYPARTATSVSRTVEVHDGDPVLLRTDREADLFCAALAAAEHAQARQPRNGG